MNYAKRQKRLDEILGLLGPGVVFREKEIQMQGDQLFRDLKELAKSGDLKNPAPGLYYLPRKLGKLSLPASENDLICAFLKTSDFRLRSLGDFNRLGLGTTQHTTDIYVYNLKRVGDFNLDGMLYKFRVRKFPLDLSEFNSNEFMIVDMMNNLSLLGENSSDLKKKVVQFWNKDLWDKNRVLEYSKNYAKTPVKRFFNKLENNDVSF